MTFHLTLAEKKGPDGIEEKNAEKTFSIYR